jgi:hypothetical protein
MKKIIIVLCITISLILSVKAKEELEWYKLYEYRVKKICTAYKPKKIIFPTESYENKKIEIKILWKKLDHNGLWDGIEEAKNIYRENMNSIYKCAMLNTQIISMNLIKKDLTKNNASLKKKLQKKLDNKINKIKLSQTKLKCLEHNKKDKNPIQKLRVLRQTTYEICKYHSYLEYLREYNSHIKNLVNENQEENKDTESYNITHLANLEKQKKEEIDIEIAHSYKIFPIAFDAYSQYENNISIHLLLELIKEDYIVYRKKLHQTINPINQVVYKIANAMKK